MTARLTALLVLFWCSPVNSLAQKQITDYQSLDGTIQVGLDEEITIELTERGYTLLLPEGKEVNGLVVVFEGRRRTLENISEPMKMHSHAFNRGLGMLYVSTGNPADFYFADESMLIIRDLIREAVKKHDLPSGNLSYVGFSLGGTRPSSLPCSVRSAPRCAA